MKAVQERLDDENDDENIANASDTESEDSSCRSSEEEFENLERLPRVLYKYALSQLEEAALNCNIDRSIGALTKARDIILALNEPLKKLYEKSLKRSDDGKVAPGSKLVKRSLLDDRYVLSLCCVLKSSFLERMNDCNGAVLLLREAILWYPKNICALFHHARLLKAFADSQATLGNVESLLRK